MQRTRNLRDLAVARINEHAGEDVWVRYLSHGHFRIGPRNISAICAVLVRADTEGITAGGVHYPFENRSSIHGTGGIVDVRRIRDGFCIYSNESIKRQMEIALILRLANPHKLAGQEKILANLIRDNMDTSGPTDMTV
jgi:hypothetical protein